MSIQTDIQNAVAALQKLDTGISEAVDQMRAEMEEQILKDVAKHGKALELKDVELQEYKDGTADAVRLWNRVEADQIGLLDTDSPMRRILFEKLADRWPKMSNSEVEELEAFLDGRLNFI